MLYCFQKYEYQCTPQLHPAEFSPFTLDNVAFYISIVISATRAVAKRISSDFFSAVLWAFKVL